MRARQGTPSFVTTSSSPGREWESAIVRLRGWRVESLGEDRLHLNLRIVVGMHHVRVDEEPLTLGMPHTTGLHPPVTTSPMNALPPPARAISIGLRTLGRLDDHVNVLNEELVCIHGQPSDGFVSGLGSTALPPTILVSQPDASLDGEQAKVEHDPRH